MARNEYEDPDFEEIQAGRLNPQDILGAQRASNVQAATDASPIAQALSDTREPADAESYRAGKNTLRGAGMAAPIRPRYADAATEQQVSAREQEGVARNTEHFEAGAARVAEQRRREDARAQAADARAQAVAQAKAARGELQNFKRAGGVTRYDEAGSEVADTHPDGRAKFQPGDLGEPPVQDEGGRWVVPHRDEFGDTRGVPAEMSPHFHEDAQTGEQTFTRDGVKLPLGVNANTVERNKLKTTQEELYRDTTEERIALSDARLAHQQAAEAVKPFAKQTGDAERRIANLTPAWNAIKARGGDASAVERQIDEARKVLADPNYLAAKAGLEAATHEIETRQKNIVTRREKSLAVARDLDKLKAARLLPATVDHREAAGASDSLGDWPADAVSTDANGVQSVDRDFVEARVAGMVAKKDDAVTPATESGRGRIAKPETPASNIAGYADYLETLKTSGIGAVGGKPIEGEIAAARATETRLQTLGVIGEKFADDDPQKAFEKFDALTPEERAGYLKALPPEKRAGFAKGLATSRAMAVVLSAGPQNADTGFDKLDPNQRKLVGEALGPEALRGLMQQRQFRAQAAADGARGQEAAANYEAKGAGGKLWANAVALYGGATKGLSPLVTAAPRLYGMFFQNGKIGERAGVSWADNVDAILDDTYGDGRKNPLAETAGQLFASTLSFLIPTGAVGIGARLLGAGEKAAHTSALTATALAGMAINGADSVAESVALGLDDKDIWKRFAIAAPVGASEMLGLPKGLEKMVAGLIKVDRATRGGFKRLMLGMAREGLAQVPEEALQEAGQSAATGLGDLLLGLKTWLGADGQRRAPTFGEVAQDSFEGALAGAAGALMFGAVFAANAHAKDRARLRQFAETIDTDGGYGVMHAHLGELRGKLATARAEGREDEVYGLKDQIAQAQTALGEAAKQVTALPEEARAKLAQVIAPEMDADGLSGQLDGNEALRFASVEIGRAMRPFYVEGGKEQAVAAMSGGNQAAVDQLIGAHAVATDLVGVLEHGKMDRPKAAALDHLGLVQLETQEDGSTIYKVTDDALPLLPAALREAVAQDTTGKYNFTVTEGQPGAVANNLVKSGEDRLRAAAEGLSTKGAKTTKAGGSVAVRTGVADSPKGTGGPLVPGTTTSAVSPKISEPVRGTGARGEPATAVGNVSAHATPGPAPGTAARLARARQVFARTFDKARAGFSRAGVSKVEESTTIPGPLAVFRGVLYFNPEQMDLALSKRTDATATEDESVALALHEELWHAVGLNAISEGEAAEVAQTAPKAMLKAASKIYNGWDRLTDFQKGHELVRMVLQGRWQGRITEQIYKAIEKVAAALRRVAAKVPEDAPLARAVARVEALAKTLEISDETRTDPEGKNAGAAGGAQPAPKESAQSQSPPAATEPVEAGARDAVAGESGEVTSRKIGDAGAATGGTAAPASKGDRARQERAAALRAKPPEGVTKASELTNSGGGGVVSENEQSEVSQNQEPVEANRGAAPAAAGQDPAAENAAGDGPRGVGVAGAGEAAAGDPAAADSAAPAEEDESYWRDRDGNPPLFAARVEMPGGQRLPDVPEWNRHQNTLAALRAEPMDAAARKVRAEELRAAYEAAHPEAAEIMAARKAASEAIGMPIPPAWRDVQYFPGSETVLVRGVDAQGRGQAFYSSAHSERALAEKFARGQRVNATMPRLLKGIEEGLARGDEEASVLRLIYLTGFRNGGEADERAKAAAYGASTLRAEHVTVEGDTVKFDFIGKLGVRQQHEIVDGALARDIAARKAHGGRLFATHDAKVRAYLKRISEPDYIVHDLRTWVATELAKRLVDSETSPETETDYWLKRDAIGDVVARKLGDTRAVVLESYIDPIVFAEWQARAIVLHDAIRPRISRKAAGERGAAGQLRRAPDAYERALRDEFLPSARAAGPGGRGSREEQLAPRAAQGTLFAGRVETVAAAAKPTVRGAALNRSGQAVATSVEASPRALGEALARVRTLELVLDCLAQ